MIALIEEQVEAISIVGPDPKENPQRIKFRGSYLNCSTATLIAVLRSSYVFSSEVLPLDSPYPQ